MDYMALLSEKNLMDNPDYPHNDIGMARLFYDMHSAAICYVIEAKTWYIYRGRFWKKDEGGLYAMEMCKDFAQALIAFAESQDDGSDESKLFTKGHLYKPNQIPATRANRHEMHANPLSQAQNAWQLLFCATRKLARAPV